jgi:predicted nucleotidyltransferase
MESLITKMKFGLSNHDIEQIHKAMKLFPEINEAVIFGSRALGSYKTGSDIDIALKGEISIDILAGLKAILDEGMPLPYTFDLVDYNKANAELKMHIDAFGQTFYSR